MGGKIVGRVQVEPEDEFSGLLVIEHLRAFANAVRVERMSWLTAVGLPAHVLSIPVIGILVAEDHAGVGLDRIAVCIVPHTAVFVFTFHFSDFLSCVYLPVRLLTH